MEKSYDATSFGYLRRARRRLAEGTDEALFYAAFELRCGIEAKLQDHLKASQEVAKHKRKGWKINQASREIEKAFKTGDKVVEYRIFTDDEKFLFCLFHTPVTRQIQKAAKRLGELLHFLSVDTTENKQWWKRTRSFLNETADGLAFINRGTISGPILQSGEHAKTIQFFLVEDSAITNMVQQHLTKGKGLRYSGHLWDQLPEHAQPFLNQID
jgi:3-hydroxy-3-methylglutaryl CoA synthase